MYLLIRDASLNVKDKENCRIGLFLFTCSILLTLLISSPSSTGMVIIFREKNDIELTKNKINFFFCPLFIYYNLTLISPPLFTLSSVYF